MKFNYSLRILLAFCVQLMFVATISAQQQPSINAGVTFFWSAAQANNSSPSVIDSIEVGSVMYNLFVVPTSYELTVLGSAGHNANHIRQNGPQLAIAGGSANALWDTYALSAFQDRNLNHYFEANPQGAAICGNFSAVPTTSAQQQTLFYSPAMPVNQGGIIAVTERGGNNCYHITTYGTPPGGGAEVQLGQTFVRNSGGGTYGAVFGPPLAGGDYWRSGRTHENNQTIAIALFNFTDMAPAGSHITRVKLTAASTDHGDGKFFILQKYANADNDTQYINSTLYDNVSTNDNVPVGSVYQVTSPPNPTGGSFTFNPDGSFVYTPPFGFTGVVTFNYEVCLPFPNNNLCDEAQVVIVVLPNAGPDQHTCIGSSVTMGAIGSGVWTEAPGNPGTSTIVDPNSPVTSITGFSSTGTYTYLWTDNGVTDEAKVFVTTVPPLPNPIGIGCE